jgi:hypothetical protein
MLLQSGYPTTIELDDYRRPVAGVYIMRTPQTPAPQPPNGLAQTLSDSELPQFYHVDGLPPHEARAYAVECDEIDRRSEARMNAGLRKFFKGQVKQLGLT